MYVNTIEDIRKIHSHIKTKADWSRLARSYENDARDLRNKFFNRTNAEQSSGQAAQWREQAERYARLAVLCREEERLARA
jgi:hypothetical protein